MRLKKIVLGAAALALASPLTAGGEAGPISLRDQGFFWVGARKEKVASPGPNGASTEGTAITGQMYVGFELPKKKRHPYPLVLVHGGGGQATDWMGTPDGRDGWLDYFVAAGFDVYFVDRPGFGRSPDVVGYDGTKAKPTTEFIANNFTARAKQYPGGGGADTREIADHTASSEPGPTVSNAVLQQDLAELLDRIGPAIMVTHSAGGPSGWLALAARPDLVKGVLAIEPNGITPESAQLIAFSPALAPGATLPAEQRPPERDGLEACSLQPGASIHKIPAFAGKKILFVGSPLSIFTPRLHCTVEQFSQFGADAKITWLTDHGIEGNGHFMNEELNNGEIAKKVFIPWLAGIK